MVDASYLVSFKGRHRFTQIELAEMWNVDRQTVARWLKGHTIPKKHHAKIKTTVYKYDNPKQGSTKLNVSNIENMGLDISVIGDNQFIKIRNKYFMMVPLVEQYNQPMFCEGSPKLDSFPVNLLEVNHPHNGDYYSFRVIGDAMSANDDSDSINAGSIVTASVVDRDMWASKIYLSQWRYFVVVTFGGILIREIIDISEDKITLRALNNDYEDMDVSLSDCKMILNIVESKTKTK